MQPMPQPAEYSLETNTDRLILFRKRSLGVIAPGTLYAAQNGSMRPYTN